MEINFSLNEFEYYYDFRNNNLSKNLTSTTNPSDVLAMAKKFDLTKFNVKFIWIQNTIFYFLKIDFKTLENETLYRLKN